MVDENREGSNEENNKTKNNKLKLTSIELLISIEDLHLIKPSFIAITISSIYFSKLRLFKSFKINSNELIKFKEDFNFTNNPWCFFNDVSNLPNPSKIKTYRGLILVKNIVKTKTN